MVSDRIMKEFRAALSYDPQPIRVIAKRLDRDPTNTRIVLTAMAELGLCEQVSLPKDDSHRHKGRGGKQASRGWQLKRL